MRELIGLALFLVARTGLFLTASAWIAAQWLQIHVIIDGHMTITMETRGFVAVDWYEGACYPFSEILTSIANETSEMLTQTESQPGSVGFSGWSYNESSQDRSITVRHSLIVTGFALMYTVLKWVYRKREAEVTE